MDTVINSFVEKSKEILQDNLVGVYLHGSAVMGCYNPAKSDIDLIVVVKESLEDSVKSTFMDMVIPVYSLQGFKFTRRLQNGISLADR